MSIPAIPIGASLVLGGARSGKSRHALALAERTASQRLFIATAEPFDGEMRERIDAHRLERAENWRTLECPLHLAGALRTLHVADGANRDVGVVLIDCLTVWLGNLMHHRLDVQAAIERLIAALQRCAVPVVLVSNEVGSGLVPDTALGRRFRDEQGRLNQRLAARCECVELVVAGLPLTIRAARES